MVRTARGIDTFDLLLDLVAAPDLSEWHWKDRDEYELGRRLGVITDDDDYAVREASERAIAMLEARRGPFAEEWATWRPEPEWPAPRLTEGSTEV